MESVIRNQDMLSSLNDIKKGITVIAEGNPCLVLEANFVRMQQRKPVMQTKLKDLVTGKVLEINYHPGDRVEEAELERRKANYLYKDENNAYFMDEVSFEQLSFSLAEVGYYLNFLKEGQGALVLYFQDKPISISIPPKVELKVVEAPPAVKGDTVSGATKPIVLETGYTVNAPLFIKEGEIVRVNTETGEYVERVNS
ncbi:MAG: elongation factor P [Parcubacteria group bacterium]